MKTAVFTESNEHTDRYSH